MPRALFIAPSAYPLGGIQTWLAYLLPGLAAHGWQATLGLTSGRQHDAAAYARTYPGLDTVFIDNPSGSAEGRVRAIALAVQRHTADVVAGVNVPDSYTAIARLRGEKRKAPRVVMTIHGIQPDLYDDARMYRDVLDGLFCTNALAMAMAQAHGVEERRLHYAPYGVELPLLLRDPGQRKVITLAYVGRLEQWQKRVTDLARIADELTRRGTSFELLIAGSGPAEADLRASMAAHVAAGRVQFLGALGPAALAAQVYARADVLLLTSSWETGPIVIWEAMAHGVSVVSSSYVGAGLEHALQHEKNCLLFPVGDSARAVECVVRLCNADVRHQLTRRARELVSQRYSRQASIAAWDERLRKVLVAPIAGATVHERTAPVDGRLDRWLGVSIGESVRRALGVRFAHIDAGGEWPHSHGSRHDDDAAFWSQARELDRWNRPHGDAAQ